MTQTTDSPVTHQMWCNDHEEYAEMVVHFGLKVELPEIAEIRDDNGAIAREHHKGTPTVAVTQYTYPDAAPDPVLIRVFLPHDGSGTGEAALTSAEAVRLASALLDAAIACHETV